MTEPRPTPAKRYRPAFNQVCAGFNRKSGLIHAPTGIGKTYAAFMVPVIAELARNGDPEQNIGKPHPHRRFPASHAAGLSHHGQSIAGKGEIGKSGGSNLQDAIAAGICGGPANIRIDNNDVL